MDQLRGKIKMALSMRTSVAAIWFDMIIFSLVYAEKKYTLHLSFDLMDRRQQAIG